MMVVKGGRPASPSPLKFRTNSDPLWQPAFPAEPTPVVECRQCRSSAWYKAGEVVLMVVIEPAQKHRPCCSFDWPCGVVKKRLYVCSQSAGRGRARVCCVVCVCCAIGPQSAGRGRASVCVCVWCVCAHCVCVFVCCMCVCCMCVCCVYVCVVCVHVLGGS